MKRSMQRREAGRRVPGGRIAAVVVAAGGLTGSVLGAGTAGAATSVVISTAKTTKFGTVLVSGKTLYTLKAGKTACGTQCLKIWPEVLLPAGVTAATAGSGVNAAKLGTVMRTGGALQVTYGGKALYYFTGDTAAGQVHGDITDTWGKWSAVVTKKPAHASSSSGTSTAGNGGASF
jgi:predicted lipoprotein with Yx(FWY)xxD motif